MDKPKKSYFIPVIAAVAIVIGILIGTFYANQFSTDRRGIINMSSNNKLNALLRIVEDQYVDTVKINELIEEAMPQILGELDPHSAYIPAKDLEAVNDDLAASFSGIGVQFTIHDDSIHINNVIHGGPSEKVGLMAGDRIVAVDDSAFVGKSVNNVSVQRKLKGPKGSTVKLGVYRPGEKELLTFTVVRGDIPVKSINASYMIKNKYGYIKVDKFAENTYHELLIALAQLNQQRCEGIIIDLRENTGGFMGAAIQMVNEFLPKDRLIVYTEGRKSPRKDYLSNGTGSNQEMPLVVLIDEGSASASEIFSGAIQDNDRGTIIGRRSFGKGLVQQPIEFSDGSAIRLTIARYYTPSGRCIQKHYSNGKDQEYEMDIYNRYEHGEFFSQDSIKQDQSTVYYTSLGRPVYGGGGIMPDYFIPVDTTGMTSYFQMARNRGLTIQFSFNYTDKYRTSLQQFTEWRPLLKYLKSQNVIEQFVRFAEGKGLKRRNIMIAKSRELLELNLYGNIIYNMLDMQSYIEYLNESDKPVLKAIEILDKKQAFPKAPEQAISNEK
ncbi:MAG: S41 family peptidase [Phocaeicola sp.]|nr:S41 family peptidase [Phocaeicola sp.]